MLYQGPEGSSTHGKPVSLWRRVRTGANATLEYLRAGSPLGGMQYRQTGPRLTLISASSQSVHRASITLSFASMNSLNQDGLPIRANRPVLSAQRMHEVLTKISSCMAPELPIMALSVGHLMPWSDGDMGVLWQLIIGYMIKTRTSVSEEKKVICAYTGFNSVAWHCQAYHQCICFLTVVVSKRAHISVTCVAVNLCVTFAIEYLKNR